MLNSGDRFGDYTVVRLLGKGGMGAVYLLKNADGGLVAAKILDPASAGDHESRKRFLREAELALGVKHPNLVETYDVGEDPDTGLCYILMEYVSGGSLADRLDEGPLPINDAIRIVYQIASVLELAREKGVVHRDIKPANIMFGADGKAKLADLGIARGGLGGANVTTVTQTGMMIGTPAYMAPEQMLDAHHVDTRADIYSLGIVFYEMLAGERPNPADTVVQLMAKAVAGEPIPDVRKMRPEVSAAVAELISLMCAMKADERVATPREVTMALSQIAHGREVTIRRKKPAAVRKASAANGRKAVAVWGGVLAVAATVAVGAWCLVGGGGVTPSSRATVVTNTIVKTVKEPVSSRSVEAPVVGASTNVVVRARDDSAEPRDPVSAKPVKDRETVWKPKIVDTGLPKKILELGNDVPPLEFVGCPAGTCEFGRTRFSGQWDKLFRIPPHKVVITRPFWIGRFPLTFEQWVAFSSPIELTAAERHLGGVKGALGRVSQDEVLAVCVRLTERFRPLLPSGYVVRLPTEAELGYARLAGSADKEDPHANRESPMSNLVSGWNRLMNNRAALKKAGVTVPDECNTPQGVVTAEFPNRWGLCGMCTFHHVFDRLPPLTKEERRLWDRPDIRSAIFERLFSGPNQYAAVRTDPLFWYEGEEVPAALATIGRESHDLRWGTRSKTYDMVRLVIGPDLLKERGLRPPRLQARETDRMPERSRAPKFAMRRAEGEMAWLDGAVEKAPPVRVCLDLSHGGFPSVSQAFYAQWLQSGVPDFMQKPCWHDLKTENLESVNVLVLPSTSAQVLYDEGECELIDGFMRRGGMVVAMCGFEGSNRWMMNKFLSRYGLEVFVAGGSERPSSEQRKRTVPVSSDCSAFKGLNLSSSPLLHAAPSSEEGAASWAALLEDEADKRVVMAVRPVGKGHLVWSPSWHYQAQVGDLSKVWVRLFAAAARSRRVSTGQGIGERPITDAPVTRRVGPITLYASGRWQRNVEVLSRIVGEGLPKLERFCGRTLDPAQMATTKFVLTGTDIWGYLPQGEKTIVTSATFRGFPDRLVYLSSFVFRMMLSGMLRGPSRLRFDDYVALLAFCELGYPNEMRLAIDEGLKNDPDFSRYKLMSGRLVEASSGREAPDPNGFVAKAKLFAACEELRRKTPDFVERWAERAKVWKGVPTELDFARALSDISGQDVPALFARHGIVLDQAGNGGPGEPPKAVVAAEQPKSNHGEQEFEWEKWFSDTVPVGAELAALQNNKAWLVRAAIEEKIGKLKAVREELKAAFDDVAKAQNAYVGGQAVAKLGRLVTKFQKLKTSPTGRSRLQLWEEQSEIVDVAEARFKLLEWLAYVKVEDGPARSAVMKALNAAQRDLKRQIPKLEKLKKQAGVEF